MGQLLLVGQSQSLDLILKTLHSQVQILFLLPQVLYKLIISHFQLLFRQHKGELD